MKPFSGFVAQRQLRLFLLHLGDALGFVVNEDAAYHNHCTDAGSRRYLVPKYLRRPMQSTDSNIALKSQHYSVSDRNTSYCHHEASKTHQDREPNDESSFHGIGDTETERDETSSLKSTTKVYNHSKVTTYKYQISSLILPMRHGRNERHEHIRRHRLKMKGDSVEQERYQHVPVKSPGHSAKVHQKGTCRELHHHGSQSGEALQLGR